MAAYTPSRLQKMLITGVSQSHHSSSTARHHPRVNIIMVFDTRHATAQRSPDATKHQATTVPYVHPSTARERRIPRHSARILHSSRPSQWLAPALQDTQTCLPPLHGRIGLRLLFSLASNTKTTRPNEKENR